MQEPDYSTYTRDELLQVSRDIDKEAFPQRYQRVMQELEKPRPTPQKKLMLSAKNMHLLGFILASAIAAFLLYQERVIIRVGRYATMEDEPMQFWSTVALAVFLALIELSQYVRARKRA
ncbi:hypothetical protein Q3O59_12825 [Alkalimonas delamerensis]|uniref:Uncharacterized protein n=1 Tax=Alkalimonas delamerensis TaxID=265981 RepID=A0ABT9GSE6_9GAMM|nr:hypothetical protein [Alkalimonas delamerensis]MDP4529905.1 hypothetical protein [Alkalimonas delamerensis]